MVNMIHRPLDDLKLAATPANDQADGFDITMAQIPGGLMLNLRFDPSDADAKAAIEAVLGTDIPTKANTRSADGAVWWLGPDEWMITRPGRDGAVADLKTQLSGALVGKHHSLVDVSHQFEGFSVSGPLARDLLAHVVTLDLHPRVMATGSVSQTVAAHCQVTFLVNDDASEYQLFTRRSFVTYLWGRLVDGAADMDVQIKPAA